MGDHVLSFAEAKELSDSLLKSIGKAIFGQQDLILETLACFLSGGHILMTGAPGLAKTTLVRVFAKNLGVQFGRVQFTPDLLPSDIIGSEILNIDKESGRRHFEFSPGPVFTGLLLADEINRATPRTQSALLEAMQERAVTVAGTRHPLPEPFMVFATQNPYESEGTFLLPDAQLDRFLLHSIVRFPSEEAEGEILRAHVQSTLEGEISQTNTAEAPIIAPNLVKGLLARIKMISVSEAIQQGILGLVRSTRPEDEKCPVDLRPLLRYGAGPRAGISLISVARATAFLSGSEEVRWAHVERMASPVLRHRIRLSGAAMRDRVTEDDVVEKLLSRLKDEHRVLLKGVGG